MNVVLPSKLPEIKGKIQKFYDIISPYWVELWGEHIPVERIASSAGTIGYELLCQTTGRVRQN